jgi:hypothetical protein
MAATFQIQYSYSLIIHVTSQLSNFEMYSVFNFWYLFYLNFLTKNILKT